MFRAEKDAEVSRVASALPPDTGVSHGILQFASIHSSNLPGFDGFIQSILGKLGMLQRLHHGFTMVHIDSSYQCFNPSDPRFVWHLISQINRSSGPRTALVWWSTPAMILGAQLSSNPFINQKGVLKHRNHRDGFEKILFLLWKHGPYLLLVVSNVRFLAGLRRIWEQDPILEQLTYHSKILGNTMSHQLIQATHHNQDYLPRLPTIQPPPKPCFSF